MILPLLDYPTHITKKLSEQQLKSIHDRINIILADNNFTESFIYNKNTKTDELNIRNSSNIKTKDPELFDLVDNIIYNDLQHENLTIMLMRDELELTRYEIGGFSKPYTDFVNFQNELFRSYSLLIGLNECKGGSTKLYLPNKEDSSTSTKTYRQVNFNETATNGGLLIFDNILEHSENIVDDGFKLILKVNLLVSIDKSLIKPDSLIIKFKDSSKIRILHKTLIDKHPKSLFALKMQFPDSNILELKEISYEDFEVVFDIMNENFTIGHLIQNDEIIDFLGLTIDTNLKEYTKSIQKEIYRLKQKCDIKIHNLTEKCSKKIDKFNRFINDKSIKCFLTSSLQEYINLKAYVKAISNILPIQLAYSYFSDRFVSKNEENIKNSVYNLVYFGINEGFPVYEYIPSTSTSTSINRNEYYYVDTNLDLSNIDSLESLRLECIINLLKVDSRWSSQIEFMKKKLSNIDLSGDEKIYLEKFILLEHNLMDSFLDETDDYFNPEYVISTIKYSKLAIPNNSDMFDKQILIKQYYLINKTIGSTKDDLVNFFNHYLNLDKYQDSYKNKGSYLDRRGYYKIKTITLFGFLKIDEQ